MSALEKQLVTLFIVLAAAGEINVMTANEFNSDRKNQAEKIIVLPSPAFSGEVTVEEAIRRRRSVRDFEDKSITLNHVSQLLWAAQGITNKEGLRAAPSAGALYPLDVYVVVGNVIDLKPGVYRYIPHGHKLALQLIGDKRKELSAAALHQNWLKNAAVMFVFSAVYERTTKKYGKRGIRYVDMEVGYSGENFFLQCEALGLSTVVVGAFDDEKVKSVLSLSTNEKPLSIMPAGFKK